MVDPLSPWGYERRHAALHGLQRYDEAIDTFDRMLSLIEKSPNPDIHREYHFAEVKLAPGLIFHSTRQ